MIYLQHKISVFFDMEKRRYRKFIRYFLFNWLSLISLNIFAQDMIKPIDRPVLLSGNFGELRATHFHSGIDIRTGGVEGLPVVCVKDGKVVRVSVSPTGYGRALYVEHEDGTTTVYGHLQRFNARITALVRQIQYEQESFKIDEEVRDRQLIFHQGDTIAFSGNTGSSGGPHLHFEVRNTRSEHTLNPLLFYKIRDSRIPVVRGVYLYRESASGCVGLVRRVALKQSANGRYTLGQLNIPAGKIGIAVFVTDYMNDSWNKLGIYRLGVVAGKDTLFAMQMDSCSFDQTCFINEIKDFDCYKKKETVYRCFGNYQGQVMGVKNRNQGWITVGEDSIVPVKIDLKDINGNRATVTLTLKGKEAPVQEEQEVLRYDRSYSLDLSGATLDLEAGALSASVPKGMKIEKDTVSGRDIFVLSEKDVPLLKKARLSVAGEFGRKALICEVDRAGRKYPLATQWSEEGLVAEIGYLSRYTIAEDRQPPVISFLGKFPDGSLKFKIKDDFSGIATYRGEVNGRWCLFSYDPRYNLMRCSLKEPVFVSGQVNEVKVIVEDRVGNKNELLVKVKK